MVRESVWNRDPLFMTIERGTFPDEELPKGRNATHSTSNWRACNPPSTDHTGSSLLNVHTSDFSELTDIPLELGAQREVEPCAAHPIGKDLEGARFTLADLQDSVYVISDDRHHGKNDCFAF